VAFKNNVSAKLIVRSFRFRNLSAISAIFQTKTTMSLPTEKVQELKQIIHNHLSQMNVHSRIKECVDESFRGDDRESGALDEAGLLNALKERGIVDDVMNTLKFEGLERERRRPEGRKRAESIEEIPTRGKTTSNQNLFDLERRHTSIYLVTEYYIQKNFFSFVCPVAMASQ